MFITPGRSWIDSHAGITPFGTNPPNKCQLKKMLLLSSSSFLTITFKISLISGYYIFSLVVLKEIVGLLNAPK